MGRQHAELPRPGVTAFISFAAHAKLARYESAGASALHTFPFDFYPGLGLDGDARDGSLIDKGVVTTPPFFGQLCRSVGAMA